MALLRLVALLLAAAAAARAQAQISAVPDDGMAPLVVAKGRQPYFYSKSFPGSNKQFLLNPLSSANATELSSSDGEIIPYGWITPLLSSTNPDTLNDDLVVVVQCDPTAWPGQVTLADAVQSAVNANVSAIIFYSLLDSHCNLTGPPPAFQYLYSMASVQDSSAMAAVAMSATAKKQIKVYVASQAALENQSSTNIGGNSTAVAMIILYSITGVITALFLIIIMTGAVRAHRHPERYGPRNVLGRPRQSRARGVARAMLDTIPIVKFGHDEPEKNVGDTELAQAGSSAEGAHAVNAREQYSNRKTPGTTTEGHEDGADGIAPGATDSVTNGSSTNDEAPGCSICTDDFEKGQDIRVLPCNHKFHAACVDPWLLDVSGTCPLCRVDLRKSDTADGSTADSHGELPPPLDPSSSASNSRRDALRALFTRRNLQDASREERISALRRFREQRRTTTDQSASNETQAVDGAQEDNRRWARLRDRVTSGMRDRS